MSLRLPTTFVLLLTATAATGASLPVDLGGAWTGALRGRPAQQAVSATATLSQTGRRLTGTIVVALSAGAQAFRVAGTVRGHTLVVRGRAGDLRLTWRARIRASDGMVRGPFRVRGRSRARGILGLRRAPGGDATPSADTACGAEFFRSDVMPRVIEPICMQCHVPGGVAAAAAFRVSAGDVAATEASAARLVDRRAPAQSRLLLKPRGELGHGGGRRYAVGSPEDQIVERWIALLVGCGGDGGGGGGGDGGGGGGGGAPDGAALFAARCASCHGADARGLDGRPDVHCHTAIHDVVRAGRGGGPLGDMPAFTDLADGEIAAIQAYLGMLCPAGVATGAELYASNCATCHGADARGGRDALGSAGPHIRCRRDVADAVRNGRSGTSGTMPSFPLLSDADVAAVQAHLATLCPPGQATGADVFGSHCARCHGADGGGLPAPAGARRAVAIRCATPARLEDAITRGRADAMPSVGLTTGNVASVLAHLDQLCTDHGRTAADVFDGNCATCHGADGAGGRNALGVHGPDMRCTERHDWIEKLTGGDDGMPPFPELLPSVDALRSWVGAACEP